MGQYKQLLKQTQQQGFSIVTWTGSGSSGTLGHGLGVAPKAIITKGRNSDGGQLVIQEFHKR